MIKIIFFLFFVLIAITIAFITIMFQLIPYQPLYQFKVPILALISAEYGGLLYLFKAIYFNKCVNKNWDEEWEIWYYIRPITSVLAGGLAFLFISAGLIAFESNMTKDNTNFGLYAFTFIAGYNVDKFLKKIEEISLTIFGITKTNMTKSDETLDTKLNQEVQK